MEIENVPNKRAHNQIVREARRTWRTQNIKRYKKEKCTTIN